MKLAPHPFTLRQLQYVVALAQELSFRKAAERCHVSQPSLSAQIAQVESALALPIFERSPRGVLITPGGRAVLERAKRLLLEADDLLEVGRRAGDPLAGTIRIGLIPTLAPYLLPTVAPALRQKFSQLSVVWREGKTDVLMGALEEGGLDAALVALEAELGDVEHEVIAADPFVLALPVGHPLARKTAPAEAAELRGVQVLLLDEGHCFREQALEVCSLARAREGEFCATSLATLVQMVAGGSGVTLLPAVAVASETSHAALRIRALASPKARRTIALAWRKRCPLAPALRQLAAVLKSAFPKPMLRTKVQRRKSSAPAREV